MKKYLLMAILIMLFLGIAYSSEAAVDTIVGYPELPGAPEPTAGIPQYIKYIFVFSLGIVGIVGFIAILIAAFNYVTSVGNPQKAADAKNRISSALLGILLLLGSYLILNTINPDLLKLKKEVGGEKVIIEVPPLTSPRTVCTYKDATVAPSEINAGQKVTLTLTRQNCTQEEVGAHKIKGDIYQEFTGLVAGKDPECFKIVNDPTEIHDTATEHTADYTFDEKCATIGCTDGGLICNEHEHRPETFYFEDWKIKFPDGYSQYVPKITITVNDLLDDGITCCR